MIPITSWRLAEEWVRSQLSSVAIPSDIGVVLVDNGCTDTAMGSVVVSDSVMLLRSEKNLGFGGAAKLASSSLPSGISICWMPGNGKISLSDCLEWLKLERKSPCPVSKAIRSGRPPVDRLKSKLVDVFLTAVTRFRWHDIGGTPTLVGSELREAFFGLAPDGIEIEAFTIAFCKQRSIQVSRSPIRYGRRLFGKSSWKRGFFSEVKLLRGFTRVALQKLP